jgi:hypothetical protein
MTFKAGSIASAVASLGDLYKLQLPYSYRRQMEAPEFFDSVCMATWASVTARSGVTLARRIALREPAKRGWFGALRVS